MNLVNKITLAVLESMAELLELCITDYEHGGYLPPEKRGIHLRFQPRAARLAKKSAQMSVLDAFPQLQQRLLLASRVLGNEYRDLSHKFLHQKAIRRG